MSLFHEQFYNSDGNGEFCQCSPISMLSVIQVLWDLSKWDCLICSHLLKLEALINVTLVTGKPLQYRTPEVCTIPRPYKGQANWGIDQSLVSGWFYCILHVRVCMHACMCVILTIFLLVLLYFFTIFTLNIFNPGHWAQWARVMSWETHRPGVQKPRCQGLATQFWARVSFPEP